jgi:hypothetical protein
MNANSEYRSCNGCLPLTLVVKVIVGVCCGSYGVIMSPDLCW